MNGRQKHHQVTLSLSLASRSTREPWENSGKKIAGIIGMSNIKNLHHCTFITITSPSSLTQSLCFLGSMLKGPNDYHKVLPYL